MSKVIDDFEIFRKECDVDPFYGHEEHSAELIHSAEESLQDWEWVGHNGNTPFDYVFGTLNKTPIQ